MALNIVELPYSYFPDFSRGRPLFNADIYVGNVDTDPEIPANQKQVTVRQEDGTEVQIAQPVKTSAGGVPTYNGSPVTVLVEGSYSIKVLDRLGGEEYYSSDVTKGVPVTPESLASLTDLVFDSVADMIAYTGPVSVGDSLKTDQFYSEFTGIGGWEYNVIAAGTYTGSEPVLKEGVHWFTLNNGLQAVIKWSWPIRLEAMGMRPDNSPNLVGSEQRLPHCIAVGDVTHGPGKFAHVGNLPTPTKQDQFDFLALIGVPLAADSEYYFTWIGDPAGDIVMDLSTTDNNGKRIGFYLSHTDIDATDYTTAGGAWDSANATGFQRNIKVNGFRFFNPNWVKDGNNGAGNPPPDAGGSNIDGEWWSTEDENSIGVCINYASNVNLDGLIVYGYTVNIWAYCWNSGWTTGRARNGRYGYVFPAGTTMNLVAPYASGCNRGYSWGAPDFLVANNQFGGIKCVGQLIASPACDTMSETAFFVNWASSVSFIQPNNEGTKKRMFYLGENITGNITIQDPNYIAPASDIVKYPIESVIEYDVNNIVTRLTVQNFRVFSGFMPTSNSFMFRVGAAAKETFLRPEQTCLINCEADLGQQYSNLSTAEMEMVQVDKTIPYIRNPETTPATENRVRFSLSDLVTFASKYGTFANSINQYECTINYARSASFDRFSITFKFALFRVGNDYSNITLLAPTTSNAYYINGSGGTGTVQSVDIVPFYDSGAGEVTFQIYPNGDPAFVFTRLSSECRYIQSA